MATTIGRKTEWTIGDVMRRFGSIPPGRIRQTPAPGTATEEDLIAANDRKSPALCELVDGVLVEKVMGWVEGYFGMRIGTILTNFVEARGLGVVAGSEGMYRLLIGLVRLPDVSFIAWDRLPEGRLPRDPICRAIPNLAIEILSKGNTKKEMAEKLREYFAGGVELVWYVDPAKKTVRVYTSPDKSRLLREGQTLDGGSVLPGFALPLNELFAEPRAGGP